MGLKATSQPWEGHYVWNKRPRWDTIGFDKILFSLWTTKKRRLFSPLSNQSTSSTKLTSQLQALVKCEVSAKVRMIHSAVDMNEVCTEDNSRLTSAIAVKFFNDKTYVFFILQCSPFALSRRLLVFFRLISKFILYGESYLFCYVLSSLRIETINFVTPCIWMCVRACVISLFNYKLSKRDQSQKNPRVETS